MNIWLFRKLVFRFLQKFAYMQFVTEEQYLYVKLETFVSCKGWPLPWQQTYAYCKNI